MICVHFQGKPFNITVIQVYNHDQECWRSWSWKVLRRPTKLSRTNTPPKIVLFIIRDWNANVGSQETPGVIGKCGFGVQNEVGQKLMQFCQENALVITNTLFQQHKKRLYTWTSITRSSILKLDWLYFLQPKMENLYTVSKNKTRSWLWLTS